MTGGKPLEDTCITCGKSTIELLGGCDGHSKVETKKSEKVKKVYYKTELQHINNSFKWRMRSKRIDI